METLLQDVRYGLRMLAKSPGFTFAAVLALALGIGAGTAVFSVVNAVLVRPLPYAEPERLAIVWARMEGSGRPHVWLSPSELVRLRGQSTLFEQFAALTDSVPLPVNFTLTGDGEPEELEGVGISASLLPLLGVSPALGRNFSPEEDRPGAAKVVMLSDGFWRSHLGADPGAIGRTLTLGGEPYAIVGVLPPHFRVLPPSSVFPADVDVWAPFESVMYADWQRSRMRHLHVLGRLEPGVTPEQAQAEMDAIARTLEREQPDLADKNWGLVAVPFKEHLVKDVRPALFVLFGAVGFVLLIACANVANLLLARSTGRAREVAIRAALGAGRLRLFRQFLAESMVLAALGGTLGLLLAVWGVDALVALSPGNIPRLDETGLDPTVLGFSLLVSMLTAALFGVLPALSLSAPDLDDVLKAPGGYANRNPRGRPLRNGLVVAEVALALMLLVGGGLMVKSYVGLQGADPGFEPENVLTMRIARTDPEFDGERGRRFFGDLLTRVGALPGVRAAGAVSQLPLSGAVTASSFSAEGAPAGAPAEVGADLRRATPGYFAAMGIALVRGRSFTDADTAGAPPVALVDEAMARRLWPGVDPVGKRIRWIRSEVPLEVVGVVRSAKHAGLSVDARETVYLSYAQFPVRSMALAVRSGADPAGLAGAVRGEVHGLDAFQPVSDVRTMEEGVREALRQPGFNTLLLGIFALVAAVLAALGIYGVMAYTVAQRTREIGIRMALGARPRGVLFLVVKQGMTLALAGVVVGLAGALVLSRVLASLLYGVSASDPATYAAITALLCGVALAACYAPARRATRVDPTVALRHE